MDADGDKRKFFGFWILDSGVSFHLRGGWGRGIALQMKTPAIAVIGGLVLLGGCKERKEMTVTETREPTTRDGKPKLFASSDERFRDLKPSPVTAPTPAGWIAQPPSEFRLLNYKFGASGTGEVWVSLASGSVLANVNRWLDQFKMAPLDAAGLAKLPSAGVAGTTGTWVTATGDYAGGMGAPPRTGYALAGIVADFGGRILTVKMIGPKAEVDAAKPELESFAKSIRLAE